MHKNMFAPEGQSSILLSRAPEKTLLDGSLEARANEILPTDPGKS